jgi:hypothetical protein
LTNPWVYGIIIMSGGQGADNEKASNAHEVVSAGSKETPLSSC